VDETEPSDVFFKAAAAAVAVPSTNTRASLMGKHLHDRFRHLTNYSVGRKYVAIQEAMAAGADEDGTAAAVVSPELKWPLQRLWDYIDANSFTSVTRAVRRPSEQVRENIAQLITRTLMAARPVIESAVSRVPMPGGYFELYGFDVMLDTQLNPFLIEVNTLPSLESSSAFDYATKTNVVADLLNVVMIEPFAREITPGGSLWNSTTLRDDLQQPLTPAEMALVNHCEEGKTGKGGSLSVGSDASREDVQLRLKDELAYARGFQRIFPAKPLPGFPYAAMGESRFSTPPFMPLSHAEHPLDSLGSRPVYLDDVRFYSNANILTPQDVWALES
jgi:hypothetical protein